MAKILVLTKDIGGFNAVRPVADLLKKQGHMITVAAEGLSLVLWQKAGYEVYGGAPKEGAFDPKTLIRLDIGPTKMINEVKPDLALATAGSVSFLEREVCTAANRQNVPVVVVNDIWGANQRLAGVKPDVICVIDSEDARLAADYCGPGGAPCIVETGSPAFDTFASQKVLHSNPVEAATSGYAQVVYILGQDESTTPYLEGVLSAYADCTDTIVIVGLHPRFLSIPELCVSWLKTVKEARVPVLWVNSVASSHQYMQASDVVVACYSTGLVEAALLGELTVSWVSDIGRQKMAAELGGLTRFPTVAYGASIEVSSVEEWRLKVLPALDMWQADGQAATRVALKTRLHVDGRAAERVVAAIDRLLR